MDDAAAQEAEREWEALKMTRMRLCSLQKASSPDHAHGSCMLTMAGIPRQSMTPNLSLSTQQIGL